VMLLPMRASASFLISSSMEHLLYIQRRKRRQLWSQIVAAPGFS
jgi:hypothetical protein